MFKVETRLFEKADLKSIKECAHIIQEGGIVAFPTETVYGLGADALNPKAVDRIFLAKGRPNDNPLIIHLHNLDSLDLYVKDIPEVFFTLSKLFMPGPLTVILKKRDIIPYNVTAGLDTVALRIPDNQIALSLIKHSNRPLAAPSANISGKPSPTTYDHVVEDLNYRVDAIINGGKTQIGMESTVLDLTQEPPVILRPGGISFNSLKLVIKDLERAYDLKEESPKSPGMKYKHYAPNAPMYIVKGKQDHMVKKIQSLIKEKTGLLVSKETFDMYESKNKLCVGSLLDPLEIASNIFESLRLFDKMDIDEIYCEYFEIGDMQDTVMNRLLKAAANKIIDADSQVSIHCQP